MEIVRGKSGTIHFDGQRCIHSRNCVLDRPDVFVPNVDGEWIHPERATAGENPRRASVNTCVRW